MRRWLLALSTVLGGCGQGAPAAPSDAAPNPSFDGALFDTAIDTRFELDTALAEEGFGFALDGSGPLPPPSCAPPVPYVTTTSLQAYCDPVHSNPPACPKKAPAGGDLCVPVGLRCSYPSSGASSGPTAAVTIFECSDGWAATAHTCVSACPTSPKEIAVAAACGSGEAIPCIGRGTDEERVADRLRSVGQCCGGFEENTLTARFADGCVSAFSAARADSVTDAQWTCLTSALGGRRIGCARALECVSVTWSTLK